MWPEALQCIHRLLNYCQAISTSLTYFTHWPARPAIDCQFIVLGSLSASEAPALDGVNSFT